ncbi:MAG: hypothetical protein KIS73_14135 [Enhydrobacter sp.]|nr:hypothetical protein [Enhydrobacter sp.]
MERRPSARRRAVFAVVFAAILGGTTLIGIEALASFFAPAWPARALRWMAPVNPIVATNEPYASRPWMAEPFNGWGMRDRERSVAKDPAYRARAVMIGDSFVEASFARHSLPASVEPLLDGVEAVNLGISATDLPSYYYRLRDVGLAMSPDVVLLFVYAGNDFVLAGEGFGRSEVPPLIGDSEGGSLLGAVMPRTRWLVRNRWPALEAPWQRRPPPDEETRLWQIAQQPRAIALGELSRHMKAYHKPHLSTQTIEEVLARGNDRFWRDLADGTAEPEFLLGWTLDSLLVWETGTFPVPSNVAQARAITPDAAIDATLSWILAIERLAASRGVRVKTFLVPVASVDAEYNEFWQPWPRSHAWNYICEDREERLVALAEQAGLRLVRLREDLQGERGTYRKRDGHWTEKGQAIVARRVAREVQGLGF